MVNRFRGRCSIGVPAVTVGKRVFVVTMLTPFMVSFVELVSPLLFFLSVVVVVAFSSFGSFSGGKAFFRASTLSRTKLTRLLLFGRLVIEDEEEEDA